MLLPPLIVLAGCTVAISCYGSSDSDNSDALDDSDEDSVASHEEVTINPPVGPTSCDSSDEESNGDKDASDTDSTATLTPPLSDTGSQDSLAQGNERPYC